MPSHKYRRGHMELAPQTETMISFSAKTVISAILFNLIITSNTNTSFAFVTQQPLLTPHNVKSKPFRSTSSFLFSPTTINKSPQFSIKDDPTFEQPQPSRDFSITDPDCIAAASQIRRILVPVPPTINKSGEVGISYVHWKATSPKPSKNNLPPILLIHGFDSSCLEFRRFGPALSSLGVDVYAVDLLGWGFTTLPTSPSSVDYSATAKVTALRSFWTTLTGDAPVVIGGASLGGAAAIDFATLDASPAVACVLLDAQGFVDGVGPVVGMLPPPLARLGVGVLKSVPLRNSANEMSYFDKERFATQDALNVGRMHCMREGWEDATMNFMRTGGFRPRDKVKDVSQRTCVIWGRQDGILDGKQFATKFMETLPNEENELHWIEECGHVPHLEQPQKTAEVIYQFIKKEEMAVDSQILLNKDMGGVAIVGAATATAIAAASYLN